MQQNSTQSDTDYNKHKNSTSCIVTLWCYKFRMLKIAQELIFSREFWKAYSQRTLGEMFRRQFQDQLIANLYIYILKKKHTQIPWFIWLNWIHAWKFLAKMNATLSYSFYS